jgi:dCMP deaminase
VERLSPRQIRRDHYFMEIARAVRAAANCLGSQVGAVLVLDDHIVSTGYNGTPHGFTNCRDGGCVRCRDRELHRQGLVGEMADPEHLPGRGLDRCICVHAEQNALLAAARFGLRSDGSTLYTTLSPCFGCLKEAIQAGVGRIVYEMEYPVAPAGAVAEQYRALAAHLCREDPTAFGALVPALAESVSR